VPAIHPVLRHLVRFLPHQRQPQVRRRVRFLAIARPVEAPGPAEVVFGPRPADRRVFLVVVQVELHLAFAPPAVRKLRPRQVRADVVPLPLHVVQQRVLRILPRRQRPPPLRVEVRRVLRHRRQGVRDLVEEAFHLLPVLALDRHLRRTPERHRPIAVEPAGRIHRHRQRVHLRPQRVPAREEVAQGHLDRRVRLIVPVNPQNRVAEDLRRNRNPDVLDHARPRDLRQRHRRVRQQVDARPHLPALTEVRRRTLPGRVGLSAAAARPRGVLRADRARLRVVQQSQIPEAETKGQGTHALAP